jgi:hypothetical protein
MDLSMKKLEQSEVGEYLLSFGAESFVFQVATQNTKIRVCRTIILPVVLYGCETWSLTLREEQRLRVFENRMLRRTFGPKRDEATGEWRKLHNEKLNDLYSSPSIIWVINARRLRWAGYVARMGEKRGAYRILMGRPEEGGHLGDPGVGGRIILRCILKKGGGQGLD